MLTTYTFTHNPYHHLKRNQLNSMQVTIPTFPPNQPHPISAQDQSLSILPPTPN